MIDIGVRMNQDRHSIPVGGGEDLFELREVDWIVDVDVGITEMQLQAGAEIWVLGTAIDLFDCVRSEGIHRAETGETVRVLRDLGAGPVIVLPNGVLFVWNRPFVRIR
jgi:hypothetical protein